MFEPVEAAPTHRASVDAVLQFAWDSAAFTSNDAMPAVGLTRSTTIEAIDELIARGLVEELPNARAGGDYRKGRPARRFSFRADAGVVIGVDAGREHLTAKIADLRGTVLHTSTLDHGLGHDSPEERRQTVADAIDGILATAGIDRSSVAAVCVGVPAPVDHEGRSPVHRDGFWHRMNPDLRTMIAEWAPAVQVENDAALTAVAEGSVGAAVGYRSYVALLAGARLGAGIVTDGILMRGRNGGAGEMIAFDHVEGVGEVGGIGYRIEEWVREGIASGGIAEGHPLAAGGGASARDVVALSRSGDPHAARIIEKAGALVARVCGMFGSLLDPEVIVISGGVADGVEDVLKVARRILPGELDLPAPRLIASPLGRQVVALGAVSAAVRSARSSLLTRLPAAVG